MATLREIAASRQSAGATGLKAFTASRVPTEWKPINIAKTKITPTKIPIKTTPLTPIKITPTTKKIDLSLLQKAQQTVTDIGTKVGSAVGKLASFLPEKSTPIQISPTQKKLDMNQLKQLEGYKPQVESATLTTQAKQQTVQKLKDLREKFRSKSIEEVRRELPKDYKEPGILGSMVEVLKEGTVSLISGGGSSMEMLGNIDIPIIRKNMLLSAAGRKIQKEADKVLAANPEWAADPLEKWGPKKIARLVTGAVPSLLAVIAATMVAGPAGAAIVGFGMEAGPTYKEAKEAGATEEQAQVYGTAVGTINGILERIFPAELLKGAGKQAVKEIGKSLWKDIAEKAVKYGVKFTANGAIEGSTEALQEMWSNIIATNYDKNRKVWNNLLESFIGGFGSGGVVAVTEQAINVRETLPSGENDPQTVINEVIKQGAENTEEGKALIKEAVIAQKTGEKVVIEKTPEKLIPDIVYHGTSTNVGGKPIEGHRGGGAFGDGIYFTDKKDYAQKYADYAVKKTGGEGKIEEAKLDLKNPFIIDRNTDINKVKEIAEVTANYPTLDNPDSPGDTAVNYIADNTKVFTQNLKKLGYDGVIATLNHGNGDFKEIVVFDRKQVSQPSTPQGGVEQKVEPNIEAKAIEKVAGTKLTDKATGLPIKVYTGQKAGYSMSNPMKVGSNDYSQYGSGIYFSPNKEIAQSYAQKGGQLYEAYLDIKNPLKVGSKNWSTFLNKPTADLKLDYLKRMGYDGIIDLSKKYPQVLVVDPKQVQLVEKSQETKVQPKEVLVPKQQLPVGEGKQKISKLEARMKGVLGNATPEQIEQLGLSTRNVAENDKQIAKASEYIINNRKDAIAVLEGEKDAPPGILRNALFVAMAQEAKTDMTLATKLASLSATRYGQELQILSEIDKNSPVKLLNEVYKVKEEEATKKYKDLNKARKNGVENIKKEIKTVNKYDWNSFISSIDTC